MRLKSLMYLVLLYVLKPNNKHKAGLASRLKNYNFKIVVSFICWMKRIKTCLNKSTTQINNMRSSFT